MSKIDSSMVARIVQEVIDRIDVRDDLSKDEKFKNKFFLKEISFIASHILSTLTEIRREIAELKDKE